MTPRIPKSADLFSHRSSLLGGDCVRGGDCASAYGNHGQIMFSEMPSGFGKVTIDENQSVIYPPVVTNIAIQHGHLWWIFSSKNVIFPG